jgi:hypothetical protein
MATFVVAKDATPEELADFMRLLGEAQPAGAVCPACRVRVAGASGLCEECTQIAGRLSFEAQVQQAEAQADAAMQEDATSVDFEALIRESAQAQQQKDGARSVPTVTVEQLDADTAHVEVCTAEGNTVFTATLPTDSTGTVRLYLAKGYTVEVLRGEDYWYDLEKDGIPF